MEMFWKSLSSDTTRSISKTLNAWQRHIDHMIEQNGHVEVCISFLFAQFHFNNCNEKIN